MARDVKAATRTLLDKCDKSDYLSLSARINEDFPNQRAFGQLKETVGGKAEWIDLNKIAQSLEKTINRLDTAILAHQGLDIKFHKVADDLHDKTSVLANKTSVSSTAIISIKEALKK